MITIKIVGLSQQRGYGPGLSSSLDPHSSPVFSDWSYSAEIEVEASVAEQSTTHKIDLPLEKWQRDAIWEARMRAQELLRSGLEEMGETIEIELGRKE